MLAPLSRPRAQTSKKRLEAACRACPYLWFPKILSARIRPRETSSGAMLAILQLVGAFVAGLFTSRRRLEAENLSPIQRLAPLRPPPVNLSGRTQALGAKLRYGMKGVGRSFLPLGTG